MALNAKWIAIQKASIAFIYILMYLGSSIPAHTQDEYNDEA